MTDEKPTFIREGGFQDFGWTCFINEDQRTKL